MSTEKTIDTTRGARGRASKKSIATRDVMTVAAMMVLTFLVCMVTGPLTMPFPFVYLYLCAGIQMFLCATFYLVVANRLNKHGVFLVWGIVYGTVLALSGYVFLLPYFAGVAAICELAMIGKMRTAAPCATPSAGPSGRSAWSSAMPCPSGLRGTPTWRKRRPTASPPRF